MSGLDKIVEQIHLQAKKEADEILNSADKYCDAYMDEVKKEVSKEVEEYNNKAKQARDLYKEKTESAIEFQKRNEMLKARQETIEDLIKKSMNRILELPDEEYFGLIERILKSNIHEGECLMYFGSKDLERLPENFKSNAIKIAQEFKCTLTIANEPRKIENGFILEYGEIEENCTFKALFDTNIDKIKDIANKELFG